MRYVKFLSFVLWMVVACVDARAQSARDIYSQAERALIEHNPTEAISLAIQSRERLGSSNPRIEGLLAQAYFQTGDVINARIAMDKLRQLVPSERQQAQDFAAYRELEERIDRALSEAQEEFEEEQGESQQRAVREAERIAASHASRSEERAEQLRAASKRKQQQLARSLQDSEDTEAMEAFAAAFPDSDYLSEVSRRKQAVEAERQRIADEPKVWREARSADRLSGYERYLRVYPDGQYRSQARERIYQVKARRQLAKARSSNLIGDFAEYRRRFPRGADIASVEATLREGYFRLGHEDLRAKNYQRARQHFRNYQRLAPANADRVAKPIRKIDRILSQRSFAGLIAVKSGPTWGALGGDFWRDETGYYVMVRARYTGELPGDVLDSDVPLPFDQDILVVEDRQNSSAQVGTEYERLDELEERYITLSAGPTRKLLYPIWVNVGVALAYREVYDHVQATELLRSTNSPSQEVRGDSELFMQRRTDTFQSSVGFGVEAGASLFVGPLNVHYGMTYLFGESIQTLGIGLNL